MKIRLIDWHKKLDRIEIPNNDRLSHIFWDEIFKPMNEFIKKSREARIKEADGFFKRT